MYKLFVCLFVCVASLGFNSHAQTLLPENDDVKIVASMPNSPLNQCDNSEEFKYKIIVKNGKTLSKVKFQIKLPDASFEIIDAKLIRPDYTNINPDPDIINTISTVLEFSKSGDLYVVDLQDLTDRQDISFRIKTGCISTNKSDNKNKIKFDYTLGSEDKWLDFTDVLTYNTTKDNLAISIINNNIYQAIRGEENFVTLRVSNKGFFSPVPNLRFNILLKAFDNAGQINNNGQIVKIKSVNMYSVYNQIISSTPINIPIESLETTNKVENGKNGKNISFDYEFTDAPITDIQEYEFKIGYEAFDGTECILNTRIEAIYNVAAICGNIECKFKPQPPSHSFSVLNPQIPQKSDIKIEIESVTKTELCSEAKGSVLIKVSNIGSKPLDITDLILNVNDDRNYNNRIIDFEDNVEVSSDGNTINYLTIPHTSPGDIQKFEIKKTFTTPITLLNASYVNIKLYFSYNQETLKSQTQYIKSLKINGKVCNVSTTFSNNLQQDLYTYDRQQSITPSKPVIDLSNVASGVSKEFYLNVTIEETPATPNDWVLTGAYSNRQITVVQPINGDFILEEVKFNNINIPLESIVSTEAYYKIANGSVLVYLNNSYQQEGQSQVLALKYSSKCESTEPNSDFDFPITYTKQISGCSTLFQLDRTATVTKNCKNNIVIPPDLCQNEIAINNTILKRISTRYKPLAKYEDYIPEYFVDANKLDEVPVPSSGEYNVSGGETIQIISDLKPKIPGINGAKLQINYTVWNKENYFRYFVPKEKFLFDVIKIGETTLTRSDEISDGFFQFDIPGSLLATSNTLDFEAQIKLAKDFSEFANVIYFTISVIPNCPSGTTTNSSNEEVFINYIGNNVGFSNSNSNFACNYQEYSFSQKSDAAKFNSIGEATPLFQLNEFEPTLSASIKTDGDKYSNWEFDLTQSVVVEYYDINQPDDVVFSTSIPPIDLTSRIELDPYYQYNNFKTLVLTLNKNSIQSLPVLLHGIGLRFRVKLKTILNTEPCVATNGKVLCSYPANTSAIYNGLDLISSSQIIKSIGFNNGGDLYTDMINSNINGNLNYNVKTKSQFLLITQNVGGAYGMKTYNNWLSILNNDKVEIKSIYVTYLKGISDVEKIKLIDNKVYYDYSGGPQLINTLQNITNTKFVQGGRYFYHYKSIQTNDRVIIIEYELKTCSEDPISIPFKLGWSCGTLPSDLLNIPKSEILHEDDFTINPAKTDLTWQVLRANDQFKPGVPSTKPALCDKVYFVGSISKMSDANVYNAKINANVAEGLLLKEAKIKKSGRPDYSKISDLQISGSVLDLSADVEAMKNGETHLLALTYESSCKNNPNQPIKLGLSGTAYCGDNISTGQSAILVKYDGVDDNDYDMDKLEVEGSSKILKTKGAEAEVKIRMSKPYVNNLPIGPNSDIETFGISSLPSQLEIVPNSVVFNVDKSTTFTPLQTVTIPNQSSNEYYFTSLTWPDNADDIIVTLKVRNKVELGASISFLDLTAGVYKFSELGANSCKCDKLKISVGILYPRIVVPPKVVYDCKECIESFYPTAGNKYIISAWVKQSNTAAATDAGVQLVFEMKDKTAAPQTTAVFTSKKAPIDGWRQIEQEFTVPAGASAIRINLVNDSGDDALFDDVRIHPFNAVMKSFVYDQRTQKISAELDERNYATFYEYDNEGQLVRVKKETEKGVMTIQESRSNQSKK